jgi:Flp pilus assembly protein TadG
MVEFALLAPVMFFMFAGMFDLLYNLGHRNVALTATQYGAITAARGHQDETVRTATVEMAMGTVTHADVQVTPCWARQAEGLPVAVTVRWYPRPLAPMMAQFWARIAANGFEFRVSLQADRPCKWDLL